MEKWDLVDANRQPLNRIHYRGDAKKNGEYHIAVGVWTMNSRGEILLTLRHSEKKEYPNKWENTGGSALSGERSREAAARELEEETGIRASPEELTFLGSCKEENAFYDSYVLKRDIEISSLSMQEGETERAQWVTLDKLKEMLADESIASPIKARIHPFMQEFEEMVTRGATQK